MQDKIEAMVDYIQGNCLWQFFSRTWDRKENIDGVLGQTEILLATGTLSEPQNDLERCHQADARILLSGLKIKLPWLLEMKPGGVSDLFEGVKARITEIAITKSRNAELNVSYY